MGVRDREVWDFIIKVLYETPEPKYRNKVFIKEAKCKIKNVMDKEELYGRLLEQIVSVKPIRGRGFSSQEVLDLLRPKLHFVYKLYKNGTLVYIGYSGGVNNRLKDHLREKDIDEIALCKCPTKAIADKLENSLILSLQPEYNKVVNLRLAKLHVEWDYTFVSAEDMNYKLIPAISFLRGSDNIKGYLYQQGMYLRNDNNVTPHWEINSINKTP
tara:strand:- start:998 stop:1639 length:642 start_codon:yes stop_codon:yes gene_type:complete